MRVSFVSSLVLSVSLLSVSSFAGVPKAGSDWTRVQALPPNTYLHVYAHTRKSLCYLTSVDAETLTCSRDTGVGHKAVSFQRAEISTIKLARRGRSALEGAAILGGAGAVAGAVEGTRSNYFAVKGAFALIYAFSGALAGAPIGYLSDFSGSTIYRAP